MTRFKLSCCLIELFIQPNVKLRLHARNDGCNGFPIDMNADAHSSTTTMILYSRENITTLKVIFRPSFEIDCKRVPLRNRHSRGAIRLYEGLTHLQTI